MKASELRIGNYHLYCIHDNLDDPTDYEVVDQVDAQDLVWLSSEAGENDTQYKPIPLTEDWLKRFGFKKNKNDDYEIEIGRKYHYETTKTMNEKAKSLKLPIIHPIPPIVTGKQIGRAHV